MKRIDYAKVKRAVTAEHAKVSLHKEEDGELPLFTKEIPATSSKQVSGKTTTITYNWKRSFTDSIKIAWIQFKGADFGDLSRLSIQDGEDSAVFQHNHIRYFIRKTTEAVAQSLFLVSERISSIAEAIVGYFKTLAGSVYVISAIENDSWTCDEQLSKSAGIRSLAIRQCTESQKSRILELVAKKLSFLHEKNLVFGRFTLRNLILTNTRSYVTDLRGLRLSRKRSVLVNEFKNTLRYLFLLGIGRHENMYPVLATYCVAHEQACGEWYQEKTGTSAPLEHIVSELEKEIIA